MKDWYTPREIEEDLCVPAYVLRNLAKRPEIRKRIRAKKTRGKYFFNSDWVCEIKEKLEKYGGMENLIYAQEASSLLGKKPHNLASWDFLDFLQLGGATTSRLYSRKQIMSLKKEVDKIPKGLLTTREVARETNFKDKEVRKHVSPSYKHPITNELFYDPKVIEEFNNRVDANCSSLREVLDFCEKNIYSKNGLRDTIRFMIMHGSIPALREEGIKGIYLPKESEKMVINIYKNLEYLNSKGVELISVREASEQIEINYQQLSRALKLCGDEQLLSLNGEKKLDLMICGENGNVELEIPYFRYVPNSFRRLLPSGVVGNLEKRLKKLKYNSEIYGFNTPYNGWYEKVAKEIMV